MSSLAHGRGVMVKFEYERGRPLSRARRLTTSQRTRRAWWRLALLLAAIMVAAAMQVGCASTAGSVGAASLMEYGSDGEHAAGLGPLRADGASRPSHDRVTPDPLNSPPDDVAPETHRLAEQSQRDVDMLLKKRQAARSDVGEANVPAGPDAALPNAMALAANSASDSTAPRRMVVWAEPQRPRGTSAEASATSTPIAASAPATQPASSQPDAPALQPDRIKQLSVDLARELYAAGAYSDHPLRELTVITSMNMVEPDRKLDPAAIPDLTEEERAVLTSLQTFFGDLNKAMEDGEGVGPGVAQAAATLRQSLVHEPQLKVPTVALCTKVGGFGDYTPFERYSFLAGSEQKAIVYLEIADFVSDINQNNEYVTELSQQLTIYSDRDGIPVSQVDWQPATDITRNKRKDFFTVQVLTLPKALSVGKYTLKVRVRDEKSKAEAETSVPFELVADAKMAAPAK